jgi:hypothetical protein
VCQTQIEIHEDKKLVCIWLTKAESADTDVKSKLAPLYEQYKQQKYLVALYRSGSADLRESTLALLRYNRKRFAERELQAEKKSA